MATAAAMASMISIGTLMYASSVGAAEGRAIELAVAGVGAAAARGATGAAACGAAGLAAGGEASLSAGCAGV